MRAEDYVIQDDFTSSEKFYHDVSETSYEHHVHHVKHKCYETKVS